MALIQSGIESASAPRIGALEAGGTKMVLAVGTADGEIMERAEIPTTFPEECVPHMIGWFHARKVDALGVGAFGPTRVNPEAADFGYVLDTPKPGWKGYDFYGELKKGLDVPIGYDTDVNVACLGEARFGAAQGLTHVVYITVGTGIGAGVLVDGKLLHGLLHPEAGHMLVARQPEDELQSVCPYHLSCLEGLASGPAIEARWGEPANALADRVEVWELESDYLAQAIANYVLCYSPQRIVLGGGVMKQSQLFPLVRAKALKNLNGYISTNDLGSMESYIIEAGCGGNQGILGCLELGRRVLCRS